MQKSLAKIDWDALNKAPILVQELSDIGNNFKLEYTKTI
jgi:hypothetical protein